MNICEYFAVLRTVRWSASDLGRRLPVRSPSAELSGVLHDS